MGVKTYQHKTHIEHYDSLDPIRAYLERLRLDLDGDLDRDRWPLAGKAFSGGEADLAAMEQGQTEKDQHMPTIELNEILFKSN